ncbi:hypothetical protein D3C73_1253250 [compost metagenome]
MLVQRFDLIRGIAIVLGQILLRQHNQRFQAGVLNVNQKFIQQVQIHIRLAHREQQHSQFDVGNRRTDQLGFPGKQLINHAFPVFSQDVFNTVAHKRSGPFLLQDPPPPALYCFFLGSNQPIAERFDVIITA